MFKKILSLFAILFIISAIAAPVYADQTVFGPEDLTIGILHVHLSSHPFSVDDPSDGVLTIVKNTPDKEIRGGFCFINGNYIGLSDFLNGTGTIFEEDVDLLSNCRITIFLRGTPGASIKIEIKKKGVTPPPEVTLSADPATIYVGQSSTLSWTSTHADTCAIEPGIGSVDLSGSITVSPAETTTYTITATGIGGTVTANATVTIANSAPVANDQTVTLNEDETTSITLTASDPNGDTLTYQIVTGPSHGTLTGSAPNITYTPVANYNGSDAFTFRVNDGTVDSTDATVTMTVNPLNDPPVANAGPDQTGLQGNVVTLNGSGASDIDGDNLTYSWTFASVPTGSTATLSDSSIVNPSFTADVAGTYEVQLIVNDGTIDSASDTVMVNIFALPTVEISADPTTILTGESSTLTWTSTHADTCVIEPGVGNVALNGSTTVSPTETTIYTITATGAGGTTTDSVIITTSLQLALTIISPLNNANIARPDVMVQGTITNSSGFETGVTVNGIVAIVNGDQFFANHVPLQEGENTIIAIATDTAENTNTTSISVNAIPEDYIKITADMESGVPFLETTLRVEGSFAFTESLLTYTGPGLVEFLDSSADEYNVGITTEGFYDFTAEVTDSQGITYTDKVTLLVLSEAELDALLTGKWEGMREALIQSNIDGAVRSFDNFSKDAYKEVFNTLSSRLPEIAQELGDIQFIRMLNNSAEYDIRTIRNGNEYSFYLLFVKNDEGLWKIRAF